MEKRLLFKDTPSKRTPRLRVRFVIYDNVGQRTLLAITVDQLKCTPRARYPGRPLLRCKGHSIFLLKTCFSNRIPSSWSTQEYMNFSIRANQDDANDSSKILCRTHYGYITKITEFFSTNISSIILWREWCSL